MTALHADLTALIERQVRQARGRVAFYADSPASGALYRTRLHLARWEAEQRVLERHSPLEWWLLHDEQGNRLEPTEENRQPTMCRCCTELRDEDLIGALEDGDEIDLGSPIVVYPCDEVRDLAARLGVEVPDA